MIRRPPRSPLFPYPPLSRSRSRRIVPSAGRKQSVHTRQDSHPVTNTQGTGVERHRHLPNQPRHFRQVPVSRSEEHTSELQSRSDLVCRLLLEKKKIKNIDQI